MNFIYVLWKDTRNSLGLYTQNKRDGPFGRIVKLRIAIAETKDKETVKLYYLTNNLGVTLRIQCTMHAMHNACTAQCMQCTMHGLHNACNAQHMQCTMHAMHNACNAQCMQCTKYVLHNGCNSQWQQCTTAVMHNSCNAQ